MRYLPSDGTKYSIIYIEQRKYYRVREQSVRNKAYGEVDLDNLHPEGTKFSIHVHRAVDIIITGQEYNQCA